MTNKPSPGTRADSYPLPLQPPPARPLRPPAYPEVQERVLSNGLRVLVVQDDRLPRFSVRLGVECGRQDNPESNLALASLAVEMLQEGTENRDTLELAEDLDRWAIQLRSEVALEYSAISLAVLQNSLNNALDILSDMLLNPSFPESELKKVKVRWQSNLVALRAQPWFLAREAAFFAHFPGHPYSRTEIPVTDLAATARSEIRDFYHANVTPGRCTLLIAGPIAIDEAHTLAESFLGGWDSPARARDEIPEPPPWSGVQVRLVHRPFSVQSRLQVSGNAPSRPHPDSLLFRLTNQVLGGSGSSRIFLNLRERNGFTYGAYSSVRNFLRSGLYLATADVGTEVTVPALREMLTEIELLRQEAPSEAELERSREELIGGLIRRLETASSAASLEIRRRLTGLPEDYYRTYVPRLRSFSPKQVLDCARRWFDPENCLITVVGDREKVEEELSRFGELEIFDTDGNRIE